MAQAPEKQWRLPLSSALAGPDQHSLYLIAAADSGLKTIQIRAGFNDNDRLRADVPPSIVDSRL